MPLTAGSDDRMIVVSDISEAASQFTVGVFVTTMLLARRWFEREFKPWNDRRPFPNEGLSYKDYSSTGPDLDGLRALMAIANRCPGLLLSVVSPKGSQRVASAKGDVKTHPELSDFRNWSDPLFERLMRSSCAISIAMDQFYCHPERWNLLHDTDQLFEPPRRETAMLWLNSFVCVVREGEITPMLLSTKEEVADSLFAKALLGLPDVAAGGTGSGLNAWNTKYGLKMEQSVGADGDLKEKDETIVLWFADGSRSLVKLIVSYGDEPDSGCVHLIGRALRGDDPGS